MMRIGIGYDLHRLEAGRPFIMGGVHIPHDKGPRGHSDGDPLCHAITDALLGAVALGNIGTHFPDTDPAFKEADSIRLLKEAYAQVQGLGFHIVNIDSNIIAQRPKLNPHIQQIRITLSEALGLPIAAVSVKPKTNETVGPEGREEAVSTQAVVLLADHSV